MRFSLRFLSCPHQSVKFIRVLKACDQRYTFFFWSISPFPLNYLSCVRFVCLLSLNQVKPRLVNTVCRSDVSSGARANKKICQTRLRAVKRTVARKVMNYTNESRWICFGLGQFPARRLQIPGGRRFLSPFQGGRETQSGRTAPFAMQSRRWSGPDRRRAHCLPQIWLSLYLLHWH